MIQAVQDNYPSSNATAGNEPQVRTWLGDVQSVPAYQVRSALLSLPPGLTSAVSPQHHVVCQYSYVKFAECWRKQCPPPIRCTDPSMVLAISIGLTATALQSALPDVY